MTLTVVALGGNALLPSGGGGIEEQREAVGRAAARIAAVRDTGREVLLTHGNGPQVGALLLQQEAAADPRPLDVLVAETQAQIGYQLQQALAPHADGVPATVVTRVLVDAADPAFDRPTKPIGPYYPPEEAADRPFETADVTRPDGTKARRRVVPSPEPTGVLESGRIETLAGDGAPVVCGGGGGVPVVADGDGYRGVAAVVDKDYTAARLGTALGASELLFLTDVPFAYEDFAGPSERPLRSVTPGDLRDLLAAGEFGTGSMRPKVEAAVRFVEGGGDRAVVTTVEDAVAALRGETGTQVRA